jgi:hypothetical protein
MDFTQRLRRGVKCGDITCRVRIWRQSRVKVGNRYVSTGVRQIEIDSIEPIEWPDITPQLAPAHFQTPKSGSKAWVGLWLDGPKLDWHAVELALRTAYEKTAPKKLLIS